MIQVIHSYPGGRNRSEGPAGRSASASQGTKEGQRLLDEEGWSPTALTRTSMAPRPYLEAAYQPYAASLVAQMVKNLPAVQETHVRSLGWEDLLEKGIYTHTSAFLTKESHGQRSLELGIFNS